MTAYPRLVDTSKGRSGADPFVIALAAAANPIMTVVTEEHPGKTKIPDVCKKEGIKFCNRRYLLTLLARGGLAPAAAPPPGAAGAAAFSGPLPVGSPK
jgi:Domain of unknown function (DUF4411)